MATRIDGEVESILERWRQSLLSRDVTAAAALRDDGYSVRLPNGQVLSKAQELDMLASPDYRIDSFRMENVRVERNGSKATAVFDCTLEGLFNGRESTEVYRSTILFRNRGGEWKAVQSHLDMHSAVAWPPARKRRSFRNWLGLGASTVIPSFQDLAYMPYRPGEDFVLPASTGAAYEPGTALPMPPPDLWLGYNYPAHGKTHVDRMLGITQTSGFAFRPGDRILDFGCGAGRMIRHLEPFAQTCEIWGTDISAEHILWCKRNLSPPFSFATTTKVPHLPFEDRSFRFIYCGSVFTHIDDLADAWLLELRRILEPGGRLYVTIHDNHTISLIEGGKAEYLNRIRETSIYRQAKEAFDMFTAGRDDKSQVFYDEAYFRRMVRTAFDVLSVTPEAYFYQTAVLLERR